jgi:hypothetical protein
MLIHSYGTLCSCLLSIGLSQLLLLLLSNRWIYVDWDLRPQEFQDYVAESDGLNLYLNDVSDVEVGLKSLHRLLIPY